MRAEAKEAADAKEKEAAAAAAVAAAAKAATAAAANAALPSTSGAANAAASNAAVTSPLPAVASNLNLSFYNEADADADFSGFRTVRSFLSPFFSSSYFHFPLGEEKMNERNSLSPKKLKKTKRNFSGRAPSALQARVAPARRLRRRRSVALCARPRRAEAAAADAAAARETHLCRDGALVARVSGGTLLRHAGVEEE